MTLIRFPDDVQCSIGPMADPHGPIRHVGTHDKTYWAGVSDNGTIVICSYDHSKQPTDPTAFAKTIIPAQTPEGAPWYYATVPSDDHNIPCIHIRSDGRIVVMWAAHKRNYFIYQVISTNPEDVSSFGAVNALEVDHGMGPIDFVATAHMSKNGRTWLMGHEARIYGYSDDDFDTVNLATGVRKLGNFTYYGTNGHDRLYLAMLVWVSPQHPEQHPGYRSTFNGEIRYFEMDETGQFYNLEGERIAHYDTLSAEHIPYESMTLALGQDPEIDIVNNVIQVTRDVYDRPLLLVQRRLYGDPNTVPVYYGSLQCNADHTWTYAQIHNNASGNINAASTNFNGPLGCIDPEYPWRAIIARETVEGAQWEIESYVTPDWRTWRLEQSVTVADTSLPLKLFRPIVPKNHRNLRIMFTGGTRNNYYDWNVATYLYFDADIAVRLVLRDKDDFGSPIQGWTQTQNGIVCTDLTTEAHATLFSRYGGTIMLPPWVKISLDGVNKMTTLTVPPGAVFVHLHPIWYGTVTFSWQDAPQPMGGKAGTSGGVYGSAADLQPFDGKSGSAVGAHGSTTEVEPFSGHAGSAGGAAGEDSGFFDLAARVYSEADVGYFDVAVEVVGIAAHEIGGAAGTGAGASGAAEASEAITGGVVSGSGSSGHAEDVESVTGATGSAAAARGAARGESTGPYSATIAVESTGASVSIERDTHANMTVDDPPSLTLEVS